MEKDNLKENETEEKEECNVDISNENKDEENNETKYLIEENEEETILKEKSHASFSKEIFANLLDQLVILAGSSLILLIADLILGLFGYQFTRESGVLLGVILFIYFVINCLYTEIMEKTKLKNTIAKRILNI